MSKEKAKTSGSADKNLKALNEKVAELTNALQIERADAINLRRRTEEDRSRQATIAKINVVIKLLPVIDSLQRAEQHVPTDLAQTDFVNGINAVIRQFEKFLSDLGIERIKTVEEAFDPRYHEAIALEEGSGTQEIVSEEIQPGYKIGDEVIRHAIVKVIMK
jgi:molecular chaperone GrpE